MTGPQLQTDVFKRLDLVSSFIAGLMDKMLNKCFFPIQGVSKKVDLLNLPQTRLASICCFDLTVRSASIRRPLTVKQIYFVLIMEYTPRISLTKY